MKEDMERVKQYEEELGMMKEGDRELREELKKLEW